MRKYILAIAFATVCSAALAQEEDFDDVKDIVNEKHSVNTNSFWANWFVQANFRATSFWGSQEVSAVKLDKIGDSYRTNAGLSLAIGKWFTPGIALRTKFSGFWGRSVVSQSKKKNANNYWTLDEQVLLNVSNMVMGYREERLWNVIPYFGGTIGRNMSDNGYAMGLGIGLLNTFRITPRIAVNLDLSYGVLEPDFDGDASYGNSRHVLKNKDRMLNVEVGLTYRLGNSSWKSSTDAGAMQALSQGEIDALNAQLSDALEEINRLNEQLSHQGQQQGEQLEQQENNPSQTAPEPISVPKMEE